MFDFFVARANLLSDRIARGFARVNNLFDRAYIASAFLNPDVVAGEPVAFEPGLPRNLVVGISLVRRPAP